MTCEERHPLSGAMRERVLDELARIERERTSLYFTPANPVVGPGVSPRPTVITTYVLCMWRSPTGSFRLIQRGM